MNQYTQILLLVSIIVIFYIFTKSTKNNVLMVESSIDRQSYIVKNLDDCNEAADMLALIRINILKLRKYLIDNKIKFKKYNEYINLLDKRVDTVIIKEKTENNNYTSYSVNKGEEIIFCLRSKNNNKLHDFNLIMYVVLHEFAHVACPEIGHTKLFKKIFKFFLEMSIILKIYEYTDYANDVKEYCGIYIDESI